MKMIRRAVTFRPDVRSPRCVEVGIKLEVRAYHFPMLPASFTVRSSAQWCSGAARKAI